MTVTDKLKTLHSTNIGLTPPARQGSFNIGLNPPARQGSLYIGLTPPVHQGSHNIGETPPARRVSLNIGLPPPVHQGFLNLGLTPPVHQGSLNIGLTPPVRQGSLTIGLTQPVRQGSLILIACSRADESCCHRMGRSKLPLTAQSGRNWQSTCWIEMERKTWTRTRKCARATRKRRRRLVRTEGVVSEKGAFYSARRRHTSWKGGKTYAVLNIYGSSKFWIKISSIKYLNMYLSILDTAYVKYYFSTSFFIHISV